MDPVEVDINIDTHQDLDPETGISSGLMDVREDQVPVSYENTLWGYFKPQHHDKYIKFVKNKENQVELTMAKYNFAEYMNYRMRLYQFKTTALPGSANVFRSDISIDGLRYFFKVAGTDIILQPSASTDEDIKEATETDNRFFYQGLVGDKYKQHYNPISSPDNWLRPNDEETGLKIGIDDVVFEVYPQVIIRDIFEAFIVTIHGLVLSVKCPSAKLLSVPVLVGKRGEAKPEDKFIVYLFDYHFGNETRSAVVLFHPFTSTVVTADLDTDMITVIGLSLEPEESSMTLGQLNYADPRFFLLEETEAGDRFITHEDYSRSITIVVEPSCENDYSVSLLKDMKAIKPEGGIEYQDLFILKKSPDDTGDKDTEGKRESIKDKNKNGNRKEESRRSLLQRLCPCLY